MTLAELADRRDALREERRTIAARDKELVAQLDELDTQLFAVLDEQGVDSTRIGNITLSISETLVPQITDWERVYEYVYATRQFHLFERRMASTAYRELRQMGVEIPGTEPFMKRAINMRKTT